MGVKKIQQFIEDNFPVKKRERQKEILLQMKCPVCGDNKKPNNKNRMRAAFIIGKNKDYIVYNCFNCGRGRNILGNIRNLAFILSRQKECSFEQAMGMLAPLTPYFVEYVGQRHEDSIHVEIDREFEPVPLPGSMINEDGARWLVGRGFTDVSFIKLFRQQDDVLFCPLRWDGMIIGYQKIHYKRLRGRYINESHGNDIHSVLFGFEHVTRETEGFVVVESLLDALLITQDSKSMIVGLALLGSVINEERKLILDSLTKPFTIALDNDSAGIRTVEKLRHHNPEWRGAYVPKPYKDYGDYRKAVGPIVALSRLVGSAVPLRSPALDLMRVQ